MYIKDIKDNPTATLLVKICTLRALNKKFPPPKPSPSPEEEKKEEEDFLAEPTEPAEGEEKA